MSWSLTQIHAGLEALQFYQKNSITATLNQHSLLLTFSEFGDLPVVVVVGEKQVLTEVALVERHEFANPAEIDYRLLTTHKFLPLSTIAIEKINGVDWYVLFSAMSKHSKIEVIAEELMELAVNTFHVIDALEPLYKFNKSEAKPSQGE